MRRDGFSVQSSKQNILIWCENKGCFSSQTVTWLFVRVKQAIIPYLKEDIQGYRDIWSTDRYFMTIFWDFLMGLLKRLNIFVTLQPDEAHMATIPQMKGKILTFSLIWAMVVWSAPSGCRFVIPVSLLITHVSYSCDCGPRPCVDRENFCDRCLWNAGCRSAQPKISSKTSYECVMKGENKGECRSKGPIRRNRGKGRKYSRKG